MASAGIVGVLRYEVDDEVVDAVAGAIASVVVAKLFDEIGPRYKSRNGGYTRVVKMGPRRGDGAFMSIIELVARPGASEVSEPEKDDQESTE